MEKYVQKRGTRPKPSENDKKKRLEKATEIES